MVNQITRCGLIVTHAAHTTTRLDEFIALCDWPVLTGPSIRALFEQIDHSRPSCLVFWLQDKTDHTTAVQLITRLRDRGARPYRIAIAEGLPESVEHTFRSAGVHTYLAASDNISALVEGICCLSWILNKPGRNTPRLNSTQHMRQNLTSPSVVPPKPALLPLPCTRHESTTLSHKLVASLNLDPQLSNQPHENRESAHDRHHRISSLRIPIRRCVRQRSIRTLHLSSTRRIPRPLSSCPHPR